MSGATLLGRPIPRRFTKMGSNLLTANRFRLHGRENRDRRVEVTVGRYAHDRVNELFQTDPRFFERARYTPLDPLHEFSGIESGDYFAETVLLAAIDAEGVVQGETQFKITKYSGVPYPYVRLNHLYSNPQNVRQAIEPIHYDQGLAVGHVGPTLLFSALQLFFNFRTKVRPDPVLYLKARDEIAGTFFAERMRMAPEDNRHYMMRGTQALDFMRNFAAEHAVT